MMKRLLIAVVVGLSAVGFKAALAHGGAQSRHGGLVQTASDLSFELVAQADGAALYVEDHGKPLSPAGMGGKLVVLGPAGKAETELKVAGDKLEARGVKLASGAKVVAVLTTPAHKTITVRFTVK